MGAKGPEGESTQWQRLTQLSRRAANPVADVPHAIWLADCYPHSAQEAPLPSDSDTHLAPFLF